MSSSPQENEWVITLNSLGKVGVVKWQWSTFEGLSNTELYEVMKVRQAVFTVEQNCPYQDADDLDQVSWHLLGWQERTTEQGLARAIVAYLRLVAPGHKYDEPSIGRVITVASARGKGLGKALLREGIDRAAQIYPGGSIRISAQQHLQKFYSEFGFKTVSEPYDEDGIPHVEMFRASSPGY